MNNGFIFFLGILIGIALTGTIWLISEREKIREKIFGNKKIKIEEGKK